MLATRRVGTLAERHRASEIGPFEDNAGVSDTGRSTSRDMLFKFGTPLVLLALALGLRLLRIDHEPVWLDEGYTLLFSGLPLDRLVTVGGAHEHPPLFYLMVHVLLPVDSSYLMPRLLSAVASAMSVLMVYLLGVRIFDRTAGIIAALLCLVSPFQIWYAQDGRAYSMASLLVLASYLSLHQAVTRPGRAAWLFYGASLVLALYSEYTTALALLPQIVVYFSLPRRMRIALLATWAAAIACFAPWLGVLAADTASVADDYWIPVPDLHAIAGTVLEFWGMAAPCGSPPCEVQGPLTFSGHPEILGLPLLCIGLIGALWSLLRGTTWTRILTWWLLLPMTLVVLLAMRRSLYLDRVFLDSTFPLYVLVGAAVAWVRSRGGGASHEARTGGRTRGRLGPPPPKALATGRPQLRRSWCLAPIVVLLLAAISPLRGIYADTLNPDWRIAARDFAPAYRQDDAVVFYPGVVRSLLTAYLPQGWHASREWNIWYQGYLDIPGWDQRLAAASDDKLRDLELSQATKGQNRVWLVAQGYHDLADARRWFTVHGFRISLSETYRGDTRIELWRRLGSMDNHRVEVPIAVWPEQWSTTGHVVRMHQTALQQGRATISTTIPVHPGSVYTVNLESRAVPPSHPDVRVVVRDRRGQTIAVFPQTKWYEFVATGAWVDQPFGWVTPPGAHSATIELRNLWGWMYWRQVSVRRLSGNGIGAGSVGAPRH